MVVLCVSENLVPFFFSFLLFLEYQRKKGRSKEDDLHLMLFHPHLFGRKPKTSFFFSFFFFFSLITPKEKKGKRKKEKGKKGKRKNQA
jgi:hypothetical protein